MAKTKRKKGGGGRGPGKKGITYAAVPSSSVATARKRSYSSGDDDSHGEVGGAGGEPKTDTSSAQSRRSSRLKGVPKQYHIDSDDDNLDDSDAELGGYPSSDDDDLVFENDEDDIGDDDDEDHNKKPSAQSTGTSDKPQKKKRRKRKEKEEALIKSDDQLREYLEKNEEYQKDRSKAKDAELVQRLMATTKKSLEKCSDDAILFMLEKAQRRGLLKGGIQEPVDTAVQGFCEYLVTSYPTCIAEKIVRYFEHLQDQDKLGSADRLTVQERIAPFADYELNCSNGFPQATENIACTNYVIYVDPKDAVSAARAVLTSFNANDVSEGKISERNIETARVMSTLPESSKSVSYVGESLHYWPDRCGPKAVGYRGNRILHDLLKSGTFRIITFNMDPAFQSPNVSDGLKKRRLLSIEMIWHINELSMGTKGERGSLCKVFGGGHWVSGTASRLHRMLNDPTLLPNGHADLLRWEKCKIDGEEQYVVRVKSFDVTNELKEEMKFPFLRRWLAQQNFLAKFPPGVDLQNDVIEIDDEDPRKSLTAFSGGVKSQKLSTGALYYFNNLFQPGKVIDMFRLERNNLKQNPSLLEGNLAERVFNAYLSSSKKPLWDEEKVPTGTVANRLALLVAKVIDVEISTLTSQLNAKLKEVCTNDETKLSAIDEDDPLMTALLNMDYKETKDYAHRHRKSQSFLLPAYDQHDYLALWRYLSWLLGVEISFDDTVTKNHLPPLDPCGGKKAGEPARAEPDPIAHSYSLLESIIFHLLNPTDISKKVASHLLDIGRNSKEERRRGVVKKSSADKYAEEDAARHRTFGFQYRAFMCRRNLGEPLANALDLPCPPKFSFTYSILLGLSSMHLMLMRVYTLATMHIPFLRTRINKWHANGMAKFFGVWKREHNKRMRRANTEDNDGDAKAKEGPSCPFALIMQPE